MGDDDYNKEVCGLIGLIIIGIFAFIIVKEITKPKTKITELVRDSSGRIVQVIEKEV